MSIYLGFDPGGEGRFGWCVARESTGGVLPLITLAVGVADHAKQAIEEALHHAPLGEPLLAAAIDAPLTWSRGAGRRVDHLLRQQIRDAGAKSAEGTVQHVNSLRGACVTQGMMAAVLLREKYAGLPLSEAHPKAWLYLSGSGAGSPEGQDERDATNACLSAWAMVRQPPDWHNLYLVSKDTETYSLLNPAPAYWMLKPKI